MSSSAPLRLRVVSAEPPSDGALCRAFLDGDREAFGELVRRHQLVVFKLVRRSARSSEEAKDLTQRAFLQAFSAAQRTLPRLLASQAEVPFRAWLLRIAINLGKNQARDTGRWRRAPVELVERTIDPRPSSEEALERAEVESLTRAAVLELPRRQREVFTLRIDAGLPFAEIARTLGISEGNAKSHFHHAVKRLKDEVQARIASGGAS